MNWTVLYLTAALGTWTVTQINIRRDKGLLFTFGVPVLLGLFWPVTLSSLFMAILYEEWKYR
jgi:hypothetical protein